MVGFDNKLQIDIMRYTDWLPVYHSTCALLIRRRSITLPKYYRPIDVALITKPYPIPTNKYSHLNGE